MMSKKTKRTILKTLLFFPLYLVMFSGILLLVSCGGPQQAEKEQVDATANLELRLQELEKKLAEQEAKLAQFTNEKADLLAQIPKPHDVQGGESHWKISYNFLTQDKGLAQEEARILLHEAPLFHPILVGFRVWNYFHNGVFGSFISQGSAKMSPGALMRMREKELKAERMKLESEIADMERKTESLLAKQDELEETKVQSEKLQTQNDSLKQDVEKLQARIEDCEARLNSVYYLADNKMALKNQGKVKGSFLGLFGDRVGDVTFSDFQSRVDLRNSDVIEINAADMNLSTIQKVKLLPKHLDAGIDYLVEVTGGGKSAKIYLQNKETFHLAQIIIAVN